MDDVHGDGLMVEDAWLMMDDERWTTMEEWRWVMDHGRWVMENVMDGRWLVMIGDGEG